MTWYGRALLLGDSLAVGLTEPLGALASRSGWAFTSDARGGTTIRQWAAYSWLGAALSARPGVVFVCLGTNDMNATAPVRAAVLEVRRRVRAAGARLVWIEPPPMPTLAGEARVRATLRDALPARELFLASRLRLERTPDRIHLTAVGSRALARALWSWTLAQPLRATLALAAAGAAVLAGLKGAAP